ncbi:hypothetical protein [Chryseobacterium potabilaquae]|nr:hypothetical protein [Chryseobacterium potabilaquae]
MKIKLPPPLIETDVDWAGKKKSFEVITSKLFKRMYIWRKGREYQRREESV